MIRAGATFCLVLAVAATPSWARDSRLPRHVGDCVRTQVKDVETRLQGGDSDEPVPGSGSAIKFTNGGYQVSYETVPAVEASRPGDLVRMCLVAIPQDCPPGDVRGREYRVTNLRTRRSWRLPDAEHMCGGA
jgi:hypothetical protein